MHLREAIDLPRGIDAAWLIDVHESRRDVKSHREIVRHLEVEIRTIIETAIQIVIVDAVATREVAHKTVLDEIASRNEILQTLRATAHVDVHIRLRGHLLKDLMIPVHVGMAVGIVARAEMLDIFFTEQWHSAIIDIRIVHQLRRLIRAEELRRTYGSLQTSLHSHVDFRFALKTATRLHHQHTISTLDTIDGCRGGIFQN